MSEGNRGPVESRQWPNELTARAVSTSETPRLFGYDVEADLAMHYRFSDTLLLSLTGELPDDTRAKGFERALIFASAMSVAEAPIHAAMLARTCGVRPGGTLAVGMLALGEVSDGILSVIGGALDDATCDGPLPPELAAQDDGMRASVARLRALVEPHLDVPAFRRDPSTIVALVAVLRACGLETPFQLSAVLSLARLPSVLAESAATKVGDFKSYPMDVPHFEYDATLRPGGSPK